MCLTSYSLAICFAPSLADSIIFLTLTRLVVVIIFENFSFALFTPPSRRLSPRQATPVSPARSRAYKAHQGFSRTHPRALDLTGARDCQSLPYTRRASGRPSTRHRRPANQAIPSPVQPSRETLRASMKLLERGIELCLAGDAGSRSPDFTRPPANVDRAPL
jgi:hypothetical protein